MRPFNIDNRLPHAGPKGQWVPRATDHDSEIRKMMQHENWCSPTSPVSCHIPVHQPLGLDSTLRLPLMGPLNADKRFPEEEPQGPMGPKGQWTPRARGSDGPTQGSPWGLQGRGPVGSHGGWLAEPIGPAAASWLAKRPWAALQTLRICTKLVSYGVRL